MTTTPHSIARAIRRHLAMKGWTQRNLCEHAKLDEGNVSRLLSGRHQPRIETVILVAEALGVPLEALVAQPPVPLYDSIAVACGKPEAVAEVAPDEWIPLGTLFGPTEDVFGIRAKGDSMKGAMIAPGDILIVRRRAAAEDRQKVLATIDGEPTVKVFRRRGRRFVLEPCNDDHQAILLDQAKDPRIVGVVVGVIRREP